MTWPDVHYKKLTVPAWSVCLICKGTGYAYERSGVVKGDCPACNGDGGKWHPKVKFGMPGCGSDTLYTKPHIIGVGPVTKSTILFQLYDPCGECGGSGRMVTHWVDGLGASGALCTYCLKDPDGPTGAAEGTGQGWEVER